MDEEFNNQECISMKKERIIKRANPKGKGHRYPQLKDGSVKLHNWRIRSTPTKQFPELVTISNNVLEISKRFITFDKAVKWIDGQHSEKLMITGGNKVQKELKTIGMGELVNKTDMGFVKPENFSYIEDIQRQDVDDPAFWS